MKKMDKRFAERFYQYTPNTGEENTPYKRRKDHSESNHLKRLILDVDEEDNDYDVHKKYS